jgi:dihydrofolate reductase
MNLEIIAAVSRNGVIGVGGRIPWCIPEDLARFRAITLGHPVIMGRKTHQSIAKRLDGRRNIVVTANPSLILPGCEWASSFAEACRMVAYAERAFVIGGETMYRSALPLASVMHITAVNDRIDRGDAFFPMFDPLRWERCENGGGAFWTYWTYRRKEYAHESVR